MIVSVVSLYDTWYVFGRPVRPLDFPPFVYFCSEPLWCFVPSLIRGTEIHQ